MKQRKKSFGMRISAFVLSFAMVCTLLAGVNVVAFAAEGDDVSGTPVYCAYNQNNGEHFFTTDKAEYDHLVSLTWGAEGEKWQAPAEATKSPIYRLYNQNSGEHYFTLDANEAKSLASIGWNDEGIGLYSDDNMGTPVYCMYNPNATGQFEAGAHHYTKDAEEAAYLESIGWTWTNDGQAAFYGVKEEEPQVLVKLTKAEQESANEITVTFDQAATGLVEKTDIVVAKADGTLVLPINSMEMAADGMSAKLTLSISMTDATDYNVMLNESVAGFTASLGEVAFVTVTTASAQKGVVTPIEFALYDSKGIDVTSTVDVDGTCEVEVSYNDAIVDTSSASKSTITMNTVGETAEVTVTYNSGDSEAVDIVGKGTITCVPAEAVVGLPIYTTVDENSDLYEAKVSENTGMAKFYLGFVDSDPVTVVEGKSSDEIYFCAANASDFTVYSYDEYEIESSDDDIMSVGNVDSSEGKQVSFKVNGNGVGTANVVIKATVNEVDTFYTIPVRVVKEGTLSTISYTVSRTTMTNAIDQAYLADSEITAYDTNGIDITDEVNYEYEVTSGKYDDDDALTNEDIAGIEDLYNGLNPGFRVNGGNEYAIYTAYASAGGKKVVKATVSEGTVSKSKSINIQVNKIANDAWNVTSGTVKEVTYQAELTNSTVNSNLEDFGEELNAKMSTVARLGAYVGGKFVGYVRYTADGYTIGTPQNVAAPSEGAVTGSAIKVKAGSGIKKNSLRFGVKYGSKYNVSYDDTAATALAAYENALEGSDVQLANTIAGTSRIGVTSQGLFTQSLKDMMDVTFADTAKIQGQMANMAGVPVYAFSPVDFATGDGNIFYTPVSKDLSSVAVAGTYTPTFAWYAENDTNNDTIKKAEVKLTVGNILGEIAGAEKVTVLSRNVDSLGDDEIIENLYAIADMNINDTSESAIVGLANANYDPWAEANDGGYVKYVVVKEQISAATNTTPQVAVRFYIPINTTFKEK